MGENVFDELKQYIGFSAADEAALPELHPLAAPHFESISEEFYNRILAHDGARKALEGGESQVGRLKGTLVTWMELLLQGPWDEAYFQRRLRIGRMHVRIELPQHYMFGAMNVVRQRLIAVAEQGAPERRPEMFRAIAKVLDLELAVMLHSYREDLLDQQARKERLATFGQLVGSIGHELRNPLAVIETSLYIRKERAPPMDEKLARHLGRIGDQVGVANRIITDLLDLIRDRPLAREPVSLEQVVASVVDAVQRPEGVAVSVEGFSGLRSVSGDASQLRQVFVNLLENAVQAVGASGRVRIIATMSDAGVQVAVEDTGPGVDPSVRRRLFEPLISTRQSGHGLGLSLVKRILTRHGGSIAYDPDPVVSGARFVVRIP